MANEFKIKKGLIVTGASGGTVVDIQGSQGQLFSVTDDLSGSIFAVSDISGVPIFDVNSSGLSTFDGNVNLPDSKKILLGTGNDFQLYHDGTHGVLNNTTGNLYTSALGALMFRTSLNVTALTLDASQNAAFTGDVSLITGKQLIFDGGTDATYISEDIADRLRFFVGGAEFMRFTESTADTVNIFKDTTFSTQAFATTATSSGDASSTLTTKGYVDSLITGATIYRGTWDPDVSLNSGYGNPDLSGVTQTSGYYYICSADGAATPNGTGNEPDSWNTGDWVIWNDDIGTGEWQKIDNSSVLSGVGTGQTVALWQGASSVTDSETLGNAPITVSGNNATFAGNIDVNSFVEIGEDGTYPTNYGAVGFGGRTNGYARIFGGLNNKNIYITSGTGGDIKFRVNGTSTNVLDIESNGNATFAGDVLPSVDSTYDIGSNSVRWDRIYADNLYGVVDQLTVNSNDTFTGTYSLLWHAGATVYSSSFMTINGTTDTLSVPNISTTGNATFAGTVTAGRNLNLSSSDYTYLQGTHTGAGDGDYLMRTFGYGDSTFYGSFDILKHDTDDGELRLRQRIAGTATDVMTIVDGNVGIGTTLPDTELHIAHNSDAGADGWLTIEDTDITVGSQRPHIVFQGNGTEIGRIRVLDTSGMQFATGSSTSIAMTIDQSQRVGIGTTSPSGAPYRLTIGDGDIYAQQAVAKITLGQFGSQGDAHFGASGLGSPTVGSQDYGFYSAHNAYRTSTGAWKHSRTSTIPAVRLLGSGGASSGNQGFSFDYSANVGTADITWTNLMQILPSGNVGIGTTSPVSTLEIAKNDQTNGATLSITNSFEGGSWDAGDIVGTIDFRSDDTSTTQPIRGQIKLFDDSASGSTYPAFNAMSFSTANLNVLNERMRIDSSGNVGIGTTSPSAKLDVDGVIRSRGGTYCSRH